MLSGIEQGAPMRDQIRSLAQELYMRGGFEGFSFGDIAAALASRARTSTIISDRNAS